MSASIRIPPFARSLSVAAVDFDVPNPELAEMHAAIWAMRLVLSKVHTRLLGYDADNFLEITGKYLAWSKATLNACFDQMSPEDAERFRAKVSGLSPDLAWQHLTAGNIDSDISLAFREMTRNDWSTMCRLLKSSILRLEKQVAKVFDPVAENVRLLQGLFDLSEADCRLLHFAGHMAQSQTIHEMARSVRTRSFDNAICSLASMLGVDAREIVKSLKPFSCLEEHWLIEVDCVPMDMEEVVSVSGNVRDCLVEAHTGIDDLMSHFIQPAGETGLRSEDFPHLAEDQTALLRFLGGVRRQQSKGVNILVYGEPGTGKTEFAKLLAHETGAVMYEVASAGRNGALLNRMERLASLRISQCFLARRQDAILLFDEIEDVFPGAGEYEFFDSPNRKKPVSAAVGKAWMNRILETNSVPAIWISNDIDQMDRAYLRRYDYHLEIRKPPVSVRHRIAQKYLQTTAVSSDFIRRIAEEQVLTPALIENAANVVSLSEIVDSKEAEQLASRVIRQCQQAMGLDSKSETRLSPTRYQLDYLNLASPYPITEIVASLGRNPSASLCFHGLPGTGKTALAEHIAETLGLPLLVKRGSDLLSKWVGDSEKNIARMFREAETDRAILFLDEADSLLQNRGGAQRNWEVSQVNELLQQMERFNGIFICATNLLDSFDAAALRRFTFKLAFKAMTQAQRVRMFCQEAMQGEELHDRELLDRLSRMDTLVPGDFAVVKRQSRIIGRVPTPDNFISELESECRIRSQRQGRSIGFVV